VDRIEQLGNDALVVGTDGADLHFTALRLHPTASPSFPQRTRNGWGPQRASGGDPGLERSPEVADEYVRKDASQGELRSQGFFYKPDGPNSGLLGLPISRAGRAGYKHLVEGSAAILFLKNDSLHFQEMGELGAGPKVALNDACRASCVDWYGNARPLFLHGRYIALLGYELVEGTIEEGQIHEMRRVSYAPGSVQALRR
jgi:hypothetical protein